MESGSGFGPSLVCRVVSFSHLLEDSVRSLPSAELDSSSSNESAFWISCNTFFSGSV